MLSGSSLNTWALTRSPLSFVMAVGESMKLPVIILREMIERLKYLPVEQIQNHTLAIYNQVGNVRNQVKKNNN